MHFTDLVGVNPGRKGDPATLSAAKAQIEMGAAFGARKLGHLHASGDADRGLLGGDGQHVIGEDCDGLGDNRKSCGSDLQHPGQRRGQPGHGSPLGGFGGR